MAEEEPVELRGLLGQYFWDYEPGRLMWPESRHTIVGRLLGVGGFDAVRWLRRNVGDPELRDFIVQRHGRGMDPKRLRYWELILKLPPKMVDGWIDAALQNPWYQRTNACPLRAATRAPGANPPAPGAHVPRPCAADRHRAAYAGSGGRIGASSRVTR